MEGKEISTDYDDNGGDDDDIDKYDDDKGKYDDAVEEDDDDFDEYDDDNESSTCSKCISLNFLSDPGIPAVRSMGLDLCPSVPPSVRHWCFVKFIDLTMVDEDTNPIPTDDAERAILGNVTMQVAKFACNANGATWWPNV